MTRKKANSPVHWVHTNITAPYRFTIANLGHIESRDGVAYSADLVHPTLGAVGQIFNEGCGGETSFYTYDRARFDGRVLEKFLSASIQDGKPLTTDSTAVASLLDDIISEVEYDEAAQAMRAQSTGLVRSVEVTDDHVYRGSALVVRRPLVTRAQRQHVADKLVDSAYSLGEDAHWEMFNGVNWVPLLDRPLLTPEETSARLGEILGWANALPGGGDRYLAGKRLHENWHIWGRPTSDEFGLMGGPRLAMHFHWCQCERRQPGYTMPFQRWENSVLAGSGVVHAAQQCRRLLSLD